MALGPLNPHIGCRGDGRWESGQRDQLLALWVQQGDWVACLTSHLLGLPMALLWRVADARGKVF